MQGTFCSRIFTNCDKKVCRLQSPNFPGIYPRNLTCYFAVRQVSVCGWEVSYRYGDGRWDLLLLAA